MSDLIVRQTLLEAALIASYGVGRQGIFRQRDLRFFYDLFSNWIDPVPGSTQRQPVQNTQIARFIESLVREQLVEKKKQAKRFTISLRSIPQLIRRFLERDYTDRPELAFFVFLFCKFYFIPYIEKNITETHRRFHVGLKRLLDLANPGLFIEAQLFFVDERLRGFERVFAIQEETGSYIAERTGTISQDEWLDEVESEVSFFLHSEKPLQKILKRGDKDRIDWEARHGRIERMQLLWKCEVERLRVFRKQLQELR